MHRIHEIPTKQYADDVFPNITDVRGIVDYPDNMLSVGYSYQDTTHSPEYYKPIYDIVEDHGTVSWVEFLSCYSRITELLSRIQSHSSFVDKDGMAVALTTTVNLIFGSAVLDPVTGVILNDEVAVLQVLSTTRAHMGYDRWTTSLHPGCLMHLGFIPLLVSIPASPLRGGSISNFVADNYPEPGKRPLSSTTPTIVEHEDGSFYAAIGGSGGSRIFPAVFQVLLNMDWGMDVSAAIEYGRLHDQLFPTMVDTDDTLPAELIDGLIEKGHNISGQWKAQTGRGQMLNICCSGGDRPCRCRHSGGCET